MCSIHIYGSHIIGQNISLNKTFGWSLEQSAKGRFISQAACTSCAWNIHRVQLLLDKPALVEGTTGAGGGIPLLSKGIEQYMC